MLENLINVLFRNTYDALTAFEEADAELEKFRGIGNGLNGLRQIRTVRHQRFNALWDVIEQAGLEDEYEAWREAAGHPDQNGLAPA